MVVFIDDVALHVNPRRYVAQTRCTINSQSVIWALREEVDEVFRLSLLLTVSHTCDHGLEGFHKTEKARALLFIVAVYAHVTTVARLV